jgi:hypothetical protein
MVGSVSEITPLRTEENLTALSAATDSLDGVAPRKPVVHKARRQQHAETVECATQSVDHEAARA